MFILGISAYYHDAAAALLHDGEIVAAAQEERFSRVKHDASFPARAIRFCLDRAGIALGDVGAVVFYEKPFLKFERILETFYAHAPRGARTFVRAMPVWLKQKLLLRSVLRDELAAIDGAGRAVPLHFSEHHLSHAASAFYPSPFDEAAVLTVDGVGEWATASIGHGRGAALALLRELRFPHSVGLLYSAFTEFLGFEVNAGEYKLMGLAPYGDPASPAVAAQRRLVETALVSVKDDGSLWLDPAFFDYAVGSHTIRAGAWTRLFGFGPRAPGAPIERRHCDLALAAQQVVEGVLLKMAREARRLTGARALCLAGGVALNCVANARIREARLFDDLWVQPAAGDAGGALGAALALHHLRFGAARPPRGARDAMQGSLLGPSFGRDEVLALARARRAPWEPLAGNGALCAAAARLLDAGKVVGWFQGRAEFGPRALGSRSILADARRPEMRDVLNLKIKRREPFRPFAPAVLVDDAATWFDLDRPSPYMTFVAPVAAARRRPVPDGDAGASVAERLRVERSEIPAVTHVDGSSRVQTVDPAAHPSFAALLLAFRARTGCGVVLNTSMNVKDEPIATTPADAYRCFMTTEMDALVMEDCLFLKERQPPWNEPAGPAPEAPSSAASRVRALETVSALALAPVGAALLTGARWPLWAALGLLATGLFWPRAARVLSDGWSALARVLGRVNTAVVLSLVFVAVLTPLALLRRTVGGRRRFYGDRAAASLWTPVERARGPDELDRPW